MCRFRQRSRVNRTLLVVCVAVAFVGTMTTGLLLAHKAARPSRSETAEAFLRDVRDARFTKAFMRLCPDEQRVESQAGFVSGLAQARNTGRGLADYHYSIPFDRGSLSAHIAYGTATFADGSTGDLTIDLADRSGGGTCVNSWRF